MDENRLRGLMALHLTETNLNEYGRFDELKASVDRKKAKDYLEKMEGRSIIPPKVPVKLDKLLRNFLLSGGEDAFV